MSDKREQTGGDDVWYILDIVYVVTEGSNDENELDSNLTMSYYQCNSYIRVNKNIYDEHNINDVINIEYQSSKRLYPTFVTTRPKSMWRKRLEKFILYLVILGSIFLIGYIGYDSYIKSGGIVAIVWSYTSGILYVCFVWFLKYAIDQCQCNKDLNRNEIKITETDYDGFVQTLQEQIDSDGRAQIVAIDHEIESEILPTIDENIELANNAPLIDSTL